MILGDVYRERGDAALARAAYEEAARRGDAMGDLQALVPALAGLARVLAGDDPEQASALAQRAAGYGAGMGEAAALLAVGHVALAAGDREGASQAARRRRARPRAGGAIAPAWPRRSSSRACRRAERPRAPRGARAGRRDLARARQPARRGPRAARARPGAAGRARRGRGPRGRGAPARARRAPADGRRPTPSPPPRRSPSRRSGAFACCATGRPSRARRGARARRATC